MSLTDDTKLLVSGCAMYLYPSELIKGDIKSSQDTFKIFKCHPFASSLGNEMILDVSRLLHIGNVKELDLKYLSIVERKIYNINIELKFSNILNILGNSLNQDCDYNHIIIGMLPYGIVPIWIKGLDRSTLIGVYQSTEYSKAQIEDEPFDITEMVEYCNYILDDLKVKTTIIPEKVYFTNLFHRYQYRYFIDFGYNGERELLSTERHEKKQIPTLIFIKDYKIDGTYEKSDDKILMNYHMASKPVKIGLKISLVDEYSIYIWLDEESISAIFDRFYGAHPETKTDFIIRIDAENKKYELALYRQGLKEPVVIPESAYQVIVFKNKFEDYRSENYNQPRGAWIW